MIKVVLDSNQFVSGFITPKGNSSKIFDLIRRKKINMIISLPILSEVNRVLSYPNIQKIHKLTKTQLDQEINNLIKFAEFITPKFKINIIKDDPTDNKFLECAIEGKADYIISGDHHLIDLISFQGINIIDPALFLKIWEQDIELIV
jgi:hypothetical protein